jgi:hypothetical protein
MAHTRPDNLLDLTSLLTEIAALPGVVQRKPGIFYYRGAGLLHFHDKDGVRWADVRGVGGWERVDIPFGAKAAQKKQLLSAVRSRVALGPVPTA